ncbi:MAG: homoserine O-succinyltransferase [Oscillospiraceae bacterium]|nr:homoserine O-succinyltransferase [Oscillospiraceae bacterium]MCL2278051.1 homoserine O-succinyltransferase [Oscillospiraceae bacterium]
MPIKIPNSLPSAQILESENIFVLTEDKALHRDIRPLKLLILNLMPTKIVTETQLLRRLSNSPLQVEVEFLQTISHKPKNTDPQHLKTFYCAFDKVRNEHYDGMIITGAPVENLPFEEVNYWKELREIMEWTKTNVHSTYHICWGAQAALYYHYGIKKYPMKKKLSGIYKHKILNAKERLFRDFDDEFQMPHSRYTEVREKDIQAVPKLKLLSTSDEAGVLAVKSADNSQVFVTGHPEYDADTLALEYFRDVEKGLEIDIPKNYFPNDDTTKKPNMYWRAHAGLIYTNWLNYFVNQMYAP